MGAQISGLIVHFQSRPQFFPNVSLMARVEMVTTAILTPQGSLGFHDIETVMVSGFATGG